MASTSDERALATWLAARDDDDLRALFTARGVPAWASWRGFFDAAAALLDEASVDRAVTRLPRAALVALASDSPAPEPERGRLQRLALIDPDGDPYAIVRTRVDAASAADPDAFTSRRPAASPVATDDTRTAAAAERALTAVTALADLLLAARDGGLGTTAGGTVAAGDRRKLVEEGIVGDGDELEDVLAAGLDAGLVRLIDRQWEITALGERWLAMSAVDRWAAVADGLRTRLPDGVRTSNGGFIPEKAWADVYPLDADWPARAVTLRRRAVRWGIVDSTGAEPSWGRALREGSPIDTSGLARLLPAEIDRVYLQADLSAIAPGPLQSPLDLRLRAMATRESRAQASTYRFSAESLGRAVTAGETAESLRGFLSRLSLTGIPQPLDYLIDSAARRSGSVRVRWDASADRTRLRIDDPHLRETIVVDRGLRAVGLVPDGDELVSKASRDAVYWSLVDARYPAVAVDGDDTPTPLRRRPIPASEASVGHDYDALIETLRAAAATDTDAAWLERELDQAVRARALIDVVVRLPDGIERSFTLEATGLGGGRLRGRDRAADVERTLPVSSITSVRPAP